MNLPLTPLEHPDECIQCGTCVSVCPVEKVGGHAIVTFLADPTETDFSVWLCTSCWRCQQACPVGVDIYGLMMAYRRRSPAPGGYLEAYRRVLETGMALPILQQTLDELRAAWGLERVLLPTSEVVQSLLRGAYRDGKDGEERTGCSGDAGLQRGPDAGTHLSGPPDGGD